MASLALGWIGEPVFAHLLEEPLRGRVSEVTLHTISFAIAFSIITFLHIVLGELAPKTFALERAEAVALAISWPLQAFYKVFQWPIRLLDWSGTRVVRLFGLHPSGEHGYTTIAGYLLAKAGRLLRPGDRIVDAAGVFSVERVEKRRISRIRFRPSQ